MGSIDANEDATAADAFLGGRVHIRQPVTGHRAGIDAVMLAAAADVGPGARILDAGAGAGTVGLCLLSRLSGCNLTAVEIDPELAKLAKENAERNGVSARYAVIQANLTGPISGLGNLGLQEAAFDVVVSNPPFYDAGSVSPAANPAKQAAGIMPKGSLQDWLRFMTAMASPRGRAFLIYPAPGLGALLAAMQSRFGAITLFPLFPRAGSAALRVIVSGVKGSRAPLSLRRGMVLHNTDGTFTEAAGAVLRHGAALDWNG